jgi:hypothetical protein
MNSKRAVCGSYLRARLLTTRRGFLGAGTAYLLARWGSGHTYAQDTQEPGESMTLSPPIEKAPTLLSAPVELAGNWGRMNTRAANQVLQRVRHACLDGVRLVSDRQPTRLRVDEHKSGPPAIWLHPEDESTMAWIIVDIGERAWIQLAYQFGHELGHVMANTWMAHTGPKPPCQWLEESMVEAFSLRGLGKLAESWKTVPPFAGDNAFGDKIAEYRQNIIERYNKLASDQGLNDDPASWFTKHRPEMEVLGLNPFAQAASAFIFLPEYERVPECVEAIGALNRWPRRTGVPIEEYLSQWEASCVELQASTHLPKRLKETLHIA